MSNTMDVLRSATRALSDEQLIAGVEMLDRGDVTSDERVVRAVICDVLEERHPGVIEALDAWIESGDDSRSYVAVLLAAIKGA